MEYTEEDLVTKDHINLKSYIILQPDVGKARRAPTILYFHVKTTAKRCLNYRI